MCKQGKSRNFIFKRSIAFTIVLCMMAGNAYMPAWAEENDNLRTVTERENTDTASGSKEDAPEKKTESEKSKSNTDLKEETDEAEKETSTEELETKPDDGVEEKETETAEEEKSDKNKTVSGNDIGEKEQKEEELKPEEDGLREKQPETSVVLEIPDIVNIVVPTAYTLALNPYGLPIQIAEDKTVTEQVISGTYGIVNKSSTDQIVTVSLTVEDQNGGELIFVDSEEEARNAGDGVYAIYLAAVPANEEEVMVGGMPADIDTIGESLWNVDMTGAWEQAVPLYAGDNRIAFKLSRAVYIFEDDDSNNGIASDDLEDTEDAENEILEEAVIPEAVLSGLAPDGSGVTAYTFCGTMNPNAPWEKLSGGIKISVVYTYWTADGNEEIIEGTGAMIRPD